MYEVHISGPRLMHTIVLPKIKKRVQYIFSRRTSRGGHIYIIVDDSQLEQFKQEFQRIKEEYETFEREHGRTSTISYTVEEMPTNIDKFFIELQKYIDLDYRVVNNTIEIAVIPMRMGQFIGKKGYKVKAMQKHLNKKIKVFKAIEKSGIGYEYFTGYRDPTRAYCITRGYVAPWKV